jgi:hypothetical protein
LVSLRELSVDHVQVSEHRGSHARLGGMAAAHAFWRLLLLPMLVLLLQLHSTPIILTRVHTVTGMRRRRVR